MPFTNTLDMWLVQYIFGAVPLSPPANLYLGLSTTTPVQAKGASTPYWNFTEPSGNGYSRAIINNATNNGNWHGAPSQPASGWQQNNATPISFPQASGSWGTVTYWGIWDAASGGNLLVFGALTTAQLVAAGGTLSFDIDQLSITDN